MNRQFITQQMSALGSFNWIHITDDVGDRHVGCGQLLHETRIAFNPGDGRGVLMKFDRLPAECADRMKRVVIDLRAGDDWNFRVQQVRKLSNDPALRLAAQAQQNQIVPSQNGVNKLRHDRFVVAHNAGKKSFAALQFTNQIRTQLVFD